MEDTDSAPLELESANSISGATKGSKIVKVWTSSLPSVALLGLDRVKITVSFPSSLPSLTIPATVIVPDEDPALIVRVPSAKV